MVPAGAVTVTGKQVDSENGKNARTEDGVRFT
jgi:hypothetical protein